MGIVLLISAAVAIALIASFRGRISRQKSAIIAIVYFTITTFTVVGNPFLKVKTVTIPNFGILLTLPWSLLLARFVASFNLTLELCAVLNALILFAILSRWRNNPVA